MSNPFDYPGLCSLVVFFNEPYRGFHLREKYVNTGRLSEFLINTLDSTRIDRHETLYGFKAMSKLVVDINARVAFFPTFLAKTAN